MFIVCNQYSSNSTSDMYCVLDVRNGNTLCLCVTTTTRTVRKCMKHRKCWITRNYKTKGIIPKNIKKRLGF